MIKPRRRLARLGPRQCDEQVGTRCPYHHGTGHDRCAQLHGFPHRQALLAPGIGQILSGQPGANQDPVNRANAQRWPTGRQGEQA